MSEPIDDGGPAFPQGSPEMCMDGQPCKDTQGMTLRDHFAGQALAGMMAFSAREDSTDPADWPKAHMATGAYAYADAMLAESKKGGSK